MRQGSWRFWVFLLGFLGGVPALLAETAAERLGERLFSDPRFAQFFAEQNGGEVNASLAEGDPALAELLLAGKTVRGPYAGQTLSCRTCHLSGELGGATGLPAHRSLLFGDVVARSAVTRRSDGSPLTSRHAPPLVGAVGQQTEGWGLFHWDGEFASPETLVQETFVGRNLGWLPNERAAAVKHFSQVIREDRGVAPWAGGRPWSYAVLLAGIDPKIPADWRLPADQRLDVSTAGDEQILAACGRLVAAYLRTLRFSRDRSGAPDGSPYDAFLEANHLSRAPAPGEPTHLYARRLYNSIAALKSPRFIDDPTRTLAAHGQPFRFGELELRGMRIFFRGTLGYGHRSSAGNCAECHVPPEFTDFAFHNTGASQDEYDAIHGSGRFMKLAVPTLAQRKADAAWRLPADKTVPGQADLGLWNVYANPAMPGPQAVIEKKLNAMNRFTPEEVLSLTLGRFKTPTLRDLGQSAPYLHNGRFQAIEEVLRFYMRMSDLAEADAMRNAPPEYASMKLAEADIAPLAAFLRSLNEDYGVETK